MNWLNLHDSVLDSHEVIGSDPMERGTWLMLQRYCIGQENSGVIENCREWPDRKWQQIARVTKKEVMRDCDLWSWNGNDLILWGYPVEKETEVKTNRLNGGKGGRPKKETGKKPRENHPVSDRLTERFEIAETERKGKERKGKEYPLTPKGDGQKNPEAIPTTPEAMRIADLYGRRHTTPWSAKEIRAFKAIPKESLEQLDLVCRYTEAERAKGIKGIHRRDLATFLNNFQGELDRAKAQQPNASERKFEFVED